MKNRNLTRFVLMCGILSALWCLAQSDLNPLIYNDAYREFWTQLMNAYPKPMAIAYITAFAIMVFTGSYLEFESKMEPKNGTR